MDEFVRNKLAEWGFHNLIERFQDEEVDKESFLCLEENEIDHLIIKAGPRSKFKKRLNELKKQSQVCGQETVFRQENVESSNDGFRPDLEPEVLPSTSNASDGLNIAKRKQDPLEGNIPSKVKRQSKTTPGPFTNECILIDVVDIMQCVHDRLSAQENTKLNAFLREKIWDLCTDKRELVGVFGKTGAGKSSLINAIIGEKDLLPTGSLRACTTVMIKVEANTKNKYEAEIEFISIEEWNDELWSVKTLYGDITKEENMTEEKDDDDDDDDDEYKAYEEKMAALYGDDWKERSPENLMESKWFREIPEFLRSGRKTVTGESAKELSAKVLKYTRTGSSEGNSIQRWYWPLVKCVTVRVPNNHLLKHVTIVDLPGNGDRNRSRDQMWKKIVATCSTVWVVSEMNRAAADKDAWEILKSACSLMGNGGECQNIYFICTKSDSVHEDDNKSDVCRNVLKRNMVAKDLVRKEFNKLSKVKKQFKDDCFEVFTVSSKEFLKQKHLQSDETEIPKLKELLQSLNNQHDQILNYVSGAYGILSLIKGANSGNMEHQQTLLVCAKLNENIEHELQKVSDSIEKVHSVFENYLKEGVKLSKELCKENLKKKLNPKGRGKGRGFHKQLKCAVTSGGVHKTKKKEINLNVTLSAFLTDSIDEEFRKAFPNDGKSGPFYGAINTFSLDTKRLIQQCDDFELQLTFLKTEEENIKGKLCKIIRHRKKIIYNSLVETVVEAMQECYKKAAEVSGTGSLEKMRHIIESHVQDVKNTMFDQAKDGVLTQLKELMELIRKEMRETLHESIELSFKTDKSIPDFAIEFSSLKNYYDQLMTECAALARSV